MPADDNAPSPHASSPDPHGQAALLLVESLIHGLVAHRAITLEDAVNLVEIALDAQVAMVEAGRSPASATMHLQAVLRTMEIDLPRDADS